MYLIGEKMKTGRLRKDEISFIDSNLEILTDEQIAEERYEARAAHGAGVELVNVITGERIVT